MPRAIILAGLALIVIGLLWPWISKLGLGKLPGDITLTRRDVSFHFPVVTCLLLSALATLGLWLLRR